MSKHGKLGAVLLVLVLVGIGAIIIRQQQQGARIRYGISPYQDTAMPKVAEALGLYRQHGLRVDLISVAWEDVFPTLASAGESIDVAIGSINTFLPRAENINVVGGAQVVFYYPLYAFKGATLMMQRDSKIKPLSAFLGRYSEDRNRAIREALQQLKGKTVAVPNGTPYEQMLFAALKLAGMDPTTDIDLRNVKLSDALLAFKNGDVDIIGAGVTQRTEAMRDGARVFLDMEMFGFAEVVGIVTTREYALSHGDELQQLIRIWFDSVDTLLSDIDTHSKHVLEYLRRESSTEYTLEEYKRALEFQQFPRSIDEASSLFLQEDGPFYWRRTWDIVNDYLEEQGDIGEEIPYSYFVGDQVQGDLE